MDRVLVQQAIDGVPITEFKGVQRPSAGSAPPLVPTKEHIIKVIKRLLDPMWRREGFIRIAQKTPDDNNMTLSTKQVKVIAQMVDAKQDSLSAEEVKEPDIRGV